MSRKCVRPLLSCVWWAAAGSKDFLSIVFIAALFKCLQQKYHTVFMTICLQCDMMSWGILISKLVFFNWSWERTWGRNSRNFELLQGEIVNAFSNGSGSPWIQFWYSSKMDMYHGSPQQRPWLESEGFYFTVFSHDNPLKLNKAVFIKWLFVWLLIYYLSSF